MAEPSELSPVFDPGDPVVQDLVSIRSLHCFSSHCSFDIPEAIVGDGVETFNAVFTQLIVDAADAYKRHCAV